MILRKLLFACEQTRDLSVDSGGFVPAVGAMGKRALATDKKMCRKAHVYVARTVAVSILKHHAKAVWNYREGKRVLLEKRIDLCFVLEGHGEEHNVLSSITLRNSIQMRDLDSTYLAAGGPERDHDDLSLQLLKIVSCSV